MREKKKYYFFKKFGILIFLLLKFLKFNVFFYKFFFKFCKIKLIYSGFFSLSSDLINSS